MTSIHGFLTSILCLIFYSRVYKEIDEFDPNQRADFLLLMGDMGVGMYGGFIGFVLMLFGCYNLSLLLSNSTSNETIRKRWNVQRLEQ